jgi:hypothetical protein
MIGQAAAYGRRALCARATTPTALGRRGVSQATAAAVRRTAHVATSPNQHTQTSPTAIG